MDVGNLWLIPASIFFNVTLYQAMKHYLVKWFCRRFLRKSVVLECDVKGEQRTNGAVVANGHVKQNKGDFYGGRKLVTDAQVACISME